MPKLSAAELRQLSGEELRNKVRELKEELFGLRFQSATGQLENTARLREVRKDIARCTPCFRSATSISSMIPIPLRRPEHEREHR